MAKQKNSFISALIAAAIGLILGIVIVAFSGTIINVLFIILGIAIIISNVPAFISSLGNIASKNGLVSFIISAISILAGILLIFWHHSIVMILIGVYLLIFPIVRIFMAKDMKAQFMSELRTIILGLILILVGPGSFIIYAGYALIILSVIYALYSLIVFLK